MNIDVLSRIKVVLVQPSHPGNIGAAARAMKTMGLTRLCLVGPRHFPSAEATARASGADDVLYTAQVVDELGQALADCTLVVGSSARIARSIPWPVLEARACAPRVLEAAASAPVALVFGREHSGLTNQELDRCHHLVQIPSNPAYSSLNLAAAVQVVAYEIYAAARATAGAADAHGQGSHEPATAREMEGLIQHLEQVALRTGFLDPTRPKKLMRRLHRLLNRAEPDKTEINILRGLLNAVQRSLGGRGRGAGGRE